MSYSSRSQGHQPHEHVMSSQMDRIKSIKEAIKDHNIAELKRLAIQHGFINNKLRKQAWPLLLGIPRPKSRSSKKRDSLKLPTTKLSLVARSSNDSAISTCSNISNQSNHDQIEKDIDRSAINFYDLTESQSESREHLGSILHSLFDESEDMHYIQGFNDVVSVFYAVCRNHEMTRKISQKVATTFLKQYIMSENEEVSFTSMKCILQIVSFHDSKLSALFRSLEEIHFLAFCVSWVLTWFAHEVQDFRVIARIYDYCLCGPESVALYLSAAVVLSLKDGLLNEVTDDISMHVFFQNLQWDTIDFDHCIEVAAMLQRKYPPFLLNSDEATPVPSTLSAISLELHRLEECEHDHDRYLMDDIKEGPFEGVMDSDDRESSSEFMSWYSMNQSGEHDEIVLFSADTRGTKEHQSDGDEPSPVSARIKRNKRKLQQKRPSLPLSIKIPRGKLDFFKGKLDIHSVPTTSTTRTRTSSGDSNLSLNLKQKRSSLSIKHGFGDLMNKFKSKTPDPPRASRAPNAPRANNKKRLSFPGRQSRRITTSMDHM